MRWPTLSHVSAKPLSTLTRRKIRSSSDCHEVERDVRRSWRDTLFDGENQAAQVFM
jgi:hypothetical protein